MQSIKRFCKITFFSMQKRNEIEGKGNFNLEYVTETFVHPIHSVLKVGFLTCYSIL